MGNNTLDNDFTIFPTKPLEDFVSVIRLWIDNLLPGGMVYGPQRAGKTQAIKYLRSHSEALLNAKIPTIFLSTWQPTPSSTTENRFFAEMLAALNYKLPDQGTAAIKRRRILSLIQEDVKERNEHRVVLFIDEAQWLTKEQLRYLMDIHNQLKINDIRLITILVGQPELVDLKKDFLSIGERHLIGRFMTATHRFNGMTGENELAKVLCALDESPINVEESEKTFTESFVPIAYAEGFRINSYSTLIWKTVTTEIEAGGGKSVRELPMQAVYALLRLLMKHLEKIDSKDLTLSKDVLDKKINDISVQLHDLAL